MQQLYFSLDKTNQLGKFKHVQTCNSYVSHCAFRVVSSVAMPKVMTKKERNSSGSITWPERHEVHVFGAFHQLCSL